MTDKQIIIDGCDVQNCEFFNYCDTDVEFSECLAHWHPNEDYSNVYYASCDAYPNCYYKQLKRDEQRIVELNKTTQAKEQEFEELKICGTPSLIGLSSIENKKLKQTLTEIKEICNKESGWVNCSNNMPTETAIFAEQILQKISECEGNDE